MKTLKQFLTEDNIFNSYAIKKEISKQLNAKGINGTKYFNSLGEVKRAIESVLSANKTHIVNSSVWERFSRGDNDIVGDKNKEILTLHANSTYLDDILISWEHLEQGYEIIYYFT